MCIRDSVIYASHSKILKLWVQKYTHHSELILTICERRVVLWVRTYHNVPVVMLSNNVFFFLAQCYIGTASIRSRDRSVHETFVFQQIIGITDWTIRFVSIVISRVVIETDIPSSSTTIQISGNYFGFQTNAETPSFDTCEIKTFSVANIHKSMPLLWWWGEGVPSIPLLSFIRSIL